MEVQKRHILAKKFGLTFEDRVLSGDSVANSEMVSIALVPKIADVYKLGDSVTVDFQYRILEEEGEQRSCNEYSVTIGKHTNKILSVHFPEFTAEAVRKFVRNWGVIGNYPDNVSSDSANANFMNRDWTVSMVEDIFDEIQDKDPLLGSENPEPKNLHKDPVVEATKDLNRAFNNLMEARRQSVGDKRNVRSALMALADTLEIIEA